MPGKESPMRASVTFVGNATTLLRLGDFTLLTDPAFGMAGSRVYLGYGAWTKRLKDPDRSVLAGVTPDAVLLSHLHGDHFDAEARHQLAPTLPIITTPQAARRLRRKRFEAAQGLPTWRSHDLVSARQRLRITAVPGKHGPGPAGLLLPDVMGSVLEWEAGGRRLLRLYITGDTLYGGHLADIPRRFGEIDAMLIHLGGTRLLGMLLTMDDRQGVEMTHLIRPGLTVPVHFDDYKVFKSPLSDYLSRAREQGLEGIRPIGRGDTVELPLRAGAEDILG
jgi:L-ascorbate metabolism protein UlaG (beta-lactamase superfamily)